MKKITLGKKNKTTKGQLKNKLGMKYAEAMLPKMRA